MALALYECLEAKYQLVQSMQAGKGWSPGMPSNEVELESVVLKVVVNSPRPSLPVRVCSMVGYPQGQ